MSFSSLRVAALALLAATSLQAQEPTTGRIQGLVLDADTKRGVSDAGVQIVGMTQGTMTRADGSYSITSVRAGTITIHVRNSLVTSTATTSGTFTAFPATVDDNTTESAFDWTPPAGSIAATGGMSSYSGKLATRTSTPLASGAVVSGTGFLGAAAPGGTKWWKGWTKYSRK